ncbi:response regulator [Microbulbifer sp.]|uniref:response regulator n=1 Tax=Microbulbifer sp. TaxID=1908541 RepID=UPI003F3036E5
MNILIAEDDRMIQVIHREVMKSFGFKFDMASNGKQAVEYAWQNQGKYDCCLMDVNMPEMNGIEATRVIRKISSYYFPILALTSNESHRKACFAAGVDDFAKKPCSRSELFDRIKKLSVKAYKLITKSSSFGVKEVMPVDKQQAEELRELARKNLCKMVLFENPNRALIVHKNTINKISHDFNVKGQLLTTFLNRDEDKPTLCHLFKESSNLLPQTLLTENEYSNMLANEDQELDRYTELSLKATDEE